MTGVAGRHGQAWRGRRWGVSPPRIACCGANELGLGLLYSFSPRSLLILIVLLACNATSRKVKTDLLHSPAAIAGNSCIGPWREERSSNHIFRVGKSTWSHAVGAPMYGVRHLVSRVPGRRLKHGHVAWASRSLRATWVHLLQMLLLNLSIRLPQFSA